MRTKRTYFNDDIAKVVDNVIHDERDRALLKRRYIDGLSYERLGEEFNLSSRQVQNIIKKHECLVFDHYK